MIKKTFRSFSLIPLSFLILLLSFSLSCNKSESETSPNYANTSSKFKDTTGPINVISVVADTAVYNALYPFLIEPDILGKELPGSLIPQSFFGFRNFSQKEFDKRPTTRMVIAIKQGEPNFINKPSMFAKNQAYMEVYGKNIGEVKEVIKKNKKQINEELEKANFSFLQSHMTNEHSEELERLGVYMKIPDQYSLVLEKPNYQWYRLDKVQTLNTVNENSGSKVGTQSIENFNIQVEKMPLEKSSFSKEEIMTIINSYGLNRLKSEDGESQLQIQQEFVYVEPVKSTESYNVYDFDGMWEMSNQLFGGSFVGRIITDKRSLMTYFALVSINAPNPDHKRENILHALSMMKSFKVLKQ